MNVVLVIIDSLRKDHVGVYGNGWIKTPNMDALAEESLRFTRPYPEAIPSIPARRGIHTGMRSFPFRGWELSNVTEDDVALWGWEPIPEWHAGGWHGEDLYEGGAWRKKAELPRYT
jgi:hypothetical protein